MLLVGVILTAPCSFLTDPASSLAAGFGWFRVDALKCSCGHLVWFYYEAKPSTLPSLCDHLAATAAYYILCIRQYTPTPSRQSPLHSCSSPTGTENPQSTPWYVPCALSLHILCSITINTSSASPLFPCHFSSPQQTLQRPIDLGLPWYWRGVVGGGRRWLKSYWSGWVVAELWGHTMFSFNSLLPCAPEMQHLPHNEITFSPLL